MAYNAPFISPYNFYQSNTQNGYMGQNFANNGYSNAMYNNQTQNVAQNQQSDGMIWVLGRNEAESYPVAPNCQVILWDKNAPTIYVKSMSANNVPNLRVLDFVERTETAQNAPKNDFKVEVDKFATKDDITALRGEFDDLRARYNELSAQTNEKSKVTTKKSKSEEE